MGSAAEGQHFWNLAQYTTTGPLNWKTHAPIGIAHEIACCCGCDHSDDDGLLETEHDEEHSNGVLFSWRMFLEVRTIA